MVNHNNNTINAVMENDIDLAGINFEQIGYFPGQKEEEIYAAIPFVGKFNGCGHRILNMNLNCPDKDNVGFFAAVGGGAVIENVIIDKSCSVTAHGFAAGLAAATVTSGDILFKGCGNEATVSLAEDEANAAGILGVVWDISGSRVFMENCYNMGIINGGIESSSLSAWLGRDAVITNCYNGSTSINGIDNGETFARFRSSSFINCYDILGQSYEGITSISSSQLSSGALCNLLNSNPRGNVVWVQDETRGYPIPRPN